MANKFLFVLVAAGLSGPGCSTPPPRSPEAELAQVNPPRYPELGEYPARSSIDVFPLFVSAPVRESCSGPVPFFYFDSTSLERPEMQAMDGLAECMKSGALRGKRVRLIGHTDPRGSDDYNHQLGLERASKVRAYLMSRGVEGERVRLASAGEIGASPFPSGWPTDRRVDVVLAR